MRAVTLPHFPHPCLAVLWRNWNRVPVVRLARVLQAPEAELKEAASLMGLDGGACDMRWLSRGYLTLIRSNWHLLTYEGLTELLGITREKLDFILKEDDFMWVKLGRQKPEAEPPLWKKLPQGWRRQAQAIGQSVKSFPAYRENAFDFLDAFYGPAQPVEPVCGGGLRMVYSYFAVYGDPLMDRDIDPYPEALLARYAAEGVNGIWLQGILYQLTPFPFAPELSAGWERRIEGLRALVERAGRYGIGVYLYLNEPRSMEEAFFCRYPQLKGYAEGGEAALCTSRDEVKAYLEDAAYALFASVPGLAGFFTITMSENLTHCYSHNLDTACPACAARRPAQVVAEVNNLLARGARRANPGARCIAWNWGWSEAWAGEVVSALSEGQSVMCTSETGMPTCVGGVPGSVIDYTISNPGPGELARRLWHKARDAGLAACAKVQFNNSWEMSAVPYLPVFGLVAQHARQLKACGVEHVMLSWTLGGAPTPVLKLATRILNAQSGETALEDFLAAEYGAQAAVVDRAQRLFSEAFRQFPFDVGVLYMAPQNYGPMSLLYPEPTGWKATMIGFPYDDLAGWRSVYPEEVFERQFGLLCDKWRQGLALLEGESGGAAFEEFVRMARACLCHFSSTLNQIRYVRARDGQAGRETLLRILAAEREATLQLMALRAQDSRLGFEASNHYYYGQRELMEKLLNLSQVAERLGEG